MGYDPLGDLLLLGLVHLVSFGHLMDHVDATRSGSLILACAQNGSSCQLLFAAAVLIIGAKWPIDGGLNPCRLLMDITVTHFGDVVEHVAPIALENVEVGPNFPVDFPPRNPVGFSNKSYKLLEIPGLVNNVLRPDLAVRVDVGLGFGAVENLPLRHGEKLVAVSTLVEIVRLFL